MKTKKSKILSSEEIKSMIKKEKSRLEKLEQMLIDKIIHEDRKDEE